MRRLIAPLLLAALLLAGCGAAKEQSSAELHSSDLFAMDTYMTLQVYGKEELLRQGEELILDLERRLSVTSADSEIAAINRDEQGPVSEDTEVLLERALELCERTGGALDLSVYPVVRAWGFTTGDYKVPEQAELDALLERVDYTKIQLEDGFVTLADGMEIDLGSVTKGYASSQVISLWREKGVTSALLNLGGNVHALGAKPDGSPWRVAIQDPFGDSYLGVLEIEDKAVITSGGYERFFEQDGETYWHIIDPATGRPARSGLTSVTVIGEDGLVCDALSTALFVMGLGKAAQLWVQSGDFEAVFVTSDGAIYITQGLEDSFSPVENYANMEVMVISRGQN